VFYTAQERQINNINKLSCCVKWDNSTLEHSLIALMCFLLLL